MMKKPKHELMTFAAGLVMLVVGLFIFSQKVIVYSSFFGGFSISGARFSSGMVVVPLIIGIVWMFATDSFLSKVFSALAGLLIVVAVIMSTNLYLRSITLYEWILILVLIFGGLGMLARVLLADRHEEEKTRNSYYEDMMASYMNDDANNNKRNRKK
jgi:hypothetical protein